MSRAVSLHIGVNQPLDRRREKVEKSETAAWQMAELACQAGYDSMLVLRSQEATLGAVHTALTGLSPTLQGGDVLLVTFSGHGGRVQDRTGDAEDRDVDGYDETWCLYDGELLDDRLSAYWQLFNPGVRIVVVSESCYGAGMGRTGEGCAQPVFAPQTERRIRYRSAPGDADAAGVGPCMVVPSRITDRIRASVLLLTASAENQEAPSGVFTELLLELWDSGRCTHTYGELHQRLSQRMMGSGHYPQLLMLGAADPDFPLAPAFHRADTGEPGRRRVFRDGGSRGRLRGG